MKLKNKLWTFGCSFTAEYDPIGGIHPPFENNFDRYYKFRGNNFPDTWTTVLANKIGYNPMNCAFGGSSNYGILNQFIEVCDLIKKDDIVIINWTYIDRFRWAAMPPFTPPNTAFPFWKKISSSTLNDKDIKEQTRIDIIQNRVSYDLYVEEVYDYQKIIDLLSKIIGFDVYYWSVDHSIIYSLSKEILNQKKYIINDLIIFRPVLRRNVPNPFNMSPNFGIILVAAPLSIASAPALKSIAPAFNAADSEPFHIRPINFSPPTINGLNKVLKPAPIGPENANATFKKANK